MMDTKQSPSKKKLISIKEEKFIREVDYDHIAGNTPRFPEKEFLLGKHKFMIILLTNCYIVCMTYFDADLEIFRKSPTQRQASQRVLVSIKPRAPAIKTLYIAEKSRFHCRKVL